MVAVRLAVVFLVAVGLQVHGDSHELTHFEVERF